MFCFSNQTLPLLLKTGWERAIIYITRVKPLSTNDVLGKDRDAMTFVSGYSLFNVLTAECNSTLNNLVYAFVPLPTASNIYATCNIFGPGLIPGTPPNAAVSPNGTLDSMISVIMHELLELSADPYPLSMPAYLYDTSENSETADLCQYNYVAGEWYYCQLPILYPDFNTSNLFTCKTLGQRKIFVAGNHPRSLKDPVTNVSFNQFGVGGSQFLVQKQWSLDNKGCVLAPEGTHTKLCSYEFGPHSFSRSHVNSQLTPKRVAC